MSDEPAPITLARRRELFERLHALLAEYPELNEFAKRQYDADPTDPRWDDSEYSPAFDPTSPMFLDGTLLCLSYVNMEGTEQFIALTPPRQSPSATIGLAQVALDTL